MHGSEEKDRPHSTPEADSRPKLMLRVFGSLAIFGVMVGLMIGRLTTPDPTELQDVQVQPNALVVWFNNEPKVHGEHVDGAVALLFEAEGRAQKGQLKINDKDANWRVRAAKEGLLLNVVAARALHAEWSGSEVDGRWRLEVQLREE
ncbi:hypothetical protein PUP49_03040 [Pseudomonas chlororaphis]|uniref:hypothetical protein n=1 Tax=Pseudomonas chlororaphis TaxID=587753 RepID=UPI0006A57807|nr:hypothetical protein [Pseudomonas chlororaphis]WDG92408.1 hypothetical protein PUP49_03040 [Pseudomonas chlororaphis]SDR86406.1 hypothetical protein SAMN05216585_0478 [Pseudomonas chlororaphis]